MTRPGLAGAASLIPPPSTEAKRIGRGAASAGRPVLRARVAGEPTQAGVCSHPSQADDAPQTPAPICSPRLTRLQGAEQPRRGPRDAAAFLEHIAQDGAYAAAALALQASPAATQGAGQFVLPHPRAPSAAPVLAAADAVPERNDSARRAGLGESKPVEAPWRTAGAQQPEFWSQEDQRELLSSGRPTGICSAEPKRLR